MRLLSFGLALSAALSAQILLTAHARAQTAPLRIVAVGASNTSGWGWGVGAERAYPRVLEEMLRSKGYDAQVTNEGLAFDTTIGMLARLDGAVPAGTDLVILQPGGNDRRFFVSEQRRAANIAEMVAQLHARHVKSIVYDPVFPPDFYSFDGIHFTAEAHTKIAAQLLPQVIAATRQERPPPGRPAPALHRSR